MIKLFLFITIIIYHAKISVCEFSSKSDCLIYNQKYSNEYLYASNNIFSTVILNIQNPNHCIYTIPFESVDDISKIKWTISQMNGTVRIKSSKGEYLCASNLYHGLFNQRRKIYLKGNDKNKQISIKNLTRNCEWRLEKVGNSQTYIIWNDLLNEPLYSPIFIYKYNSIKRYVYSWKNEEQSKDSEFKWFINCGKDGMFNSKNLFH